MLLDILTNSFKDVMDQFFLDQSPIQVVLEVLGCYVTFVTFFVGVYMWKRIDSLEMELLDIQLKEIEDSADDKIDSLFQDDDSVSFEVAKAEMDE